MENWKDQMLLGLPDLIKEVQEENERQIKKWGIQEHDVFAWHTILAEEVGELAQEMLNHKFGKQPPVLVVKEAIQVATLALKIAEMAIMNC